MSFPVLNRSLSFNEETLRWMEEKVISAGNLAKKVALYIGNGKSAQDWTVQSIKSREGCSLSQFSEIRKSVREVESSLISEIAMRYLDPNQRHLELGAGKLDDGLSYLMSRMPINLQKSIEPTDVNRYFTDNQENIPLKRVDAVELDKSYPLGSMQGILASAFLDTLPKSDLDLTLRRIYQVLKKEGFLIHFSSLEPFTDTLLSENNDETLVYFPWIDGEWDFKGLQVAPKKEFLQFLETTKKVDNHAIDFLKWYAELSGQLRELTLNDLVLSGAEEQRKACLIFSNLISQLNPPKLRFIANEIFSDERIRASLTHEGFKILQFERVIRHDIFDGIPNEKGYNYYSLRNRILFKKFAPLAPGKTFQDVRMSVLVAQKP